MKILKFILLVFIVIVVIQACKTKKEIVNSDKNDTIIKMASIDTLLTLKYFLDDTTMFCYTNSDILTLKEQVPSEKLNCFDFDDWKCEKKSDIAGLIWRCLGRDSVDKYMPVFETNSHKSTKNEVLKEKNEAMLMAVDSDIILGDPGSPYKLKSITNAPPIVKNIYKNYPLVSIVGYYYKTETIGTIHNGEISDATSILNIAYNSIKQETTVSLKERFEALLLLLYGFNTKITINSFNEINEDEFTHKINATINGKLRFYRISHQYDGINVMQELSVNNKIISSKSIRY